MRMRALLTRVLATLTACLFLAGCQAPGREGNVGAGAAPTAAGAAVFLKASLTGAQCVPAVDTPGLGAGAMTYEPASGLLRWTVTFDRLSSPATAAHFHGPADTRSNAGVAVPIAGPGMTAPVSGSATLTAEQAAELLAGLWYVNVHTATFPGGEIRGQVLRAN